MSTEKQYSERERQFVNSLIASFGPDGAVDACRRSRWNGLVKLAQVVSAERMMCW